MRLTRPGIATATVLVLGVVLSFLSAPVIQIAGFCIVIVALVLFAGDWVRSGEGQLVRGSGGGDGADPDAFDDCPL